MLSDRASENGESMTIHSLMECIASDDYAKCDSR